MPRALTLALLLSACVGLSGTTIFVGQVAPEAGTCDPASQGVLTQRGKAIVFSANNGTLILSGTRSGNDLTASLGLLGADKKPFDLFFSGQVSGTRISGTYVTPRCRYTVTLSLTQD